MRLPQIAVRSVLTLSLTSLLTLTILVRPSAAQLADGADKGKPGVLTVTPASLSFGNVQLGHSATLVTTLSNTGGGDLTIYYATVQGKGFTTSALGLPLTLTPGQSYTVSITFVPQSSGSASGNFWLGSQHRRLTRAVPLSGTGTPAGQLTVSPATLDFGSVTVGKSKSLTGTLTAAGTNVMVSSGISSSPEFVLSGLSLPFTISAGQSVSFTMGFAPQASGAASATLAFESDAANSPAVEALTGTGANPPRPHSVDLRWDPSPSAVAGYDVYRGNSSGGPYTRINSELEQSTTYSDTSVENGKTYYYVTSAMDDNGNESRYSNEAQAVIPSP
jgi:hypothetical protein